MVDFRVMSRLQWSMHSAKTRVYNDIHNFAAYDYLKLNQLGQKIEQIKSDFEIFHNQF